MFQSSSYNIQSKWSNPEFRNSDSENEYLNEYSNSRRQKTGKASKIFYNNAEKRGYSRDSRISSNLKLSNQRRVSTGNSSIKSRSSSVKSPPKIRKNERLNKSKIENETNTFTKGSALSSAA